MISTRVPSLAWLCLRVLARYPGHIPIDVRLNYGSLHSNVLDDVDPALWAVLVQVYDGLPNHLHSLTIPLADPNVSLFQKIPQTSLFSLITVLDLPACPHLTDTSIVHLSSLHSLVALDASATSLSSYAIKVLSGTLLWIDDSPQRRGPWLLRVLRLRFCDKIGDSVYSHLAKFPLLAVIGHIYAYLTPNDIDYYSDLRGTKCSPPKDEMKTFKPSSRLELFHPAPLAAAVNALEGANLYTSKNVFHLLIDSLERSKAICGLPQHTIEQNKPVGSHDTVVESTVAPSISDTITLEPTPSMFYSQPSRSSRPVKYDLVNNYRAKTYYTWAHLEVAARPSGSHDSELALYRIPPPWISLEERSTFLLHQMETRRFTRDEAVTCVASINRTAKIFQINQARIDALRESASAKRRSGVSASMNTPESKRAPAQGKNPFRRYSLPGVVRDPDRGMKDLKHISAVEVPELSLNLKSDGRMKRRIHSNAFADTPLVKTSSSVRTSLDRTKSFSLHSTWSGPSDSPLTAIKRMPSVDSSRANVKNPRVKGGSASSDKGKGKTTAQAKNSFDWNLWSAKKS